MSEDKKVTMKDRQKENRLYRERKAKKQWKIQSYLMPICLVEDVRHFIQVKVKELGLKS